MQQGEVKQAADVGCVPGEFESCKWMVFKSTRMYSETLACRVLCVCFQEALPASNTALIVGAVCAALFLLVLIAVGACVVMRMLHNRHDYEG